MHIDQVIAVGPLIMMRAVCEMTRLYRSPPREPQPDHGRRHRHVRRLPGTVGGETRFACVDGPHFDGHKVDFDELIQRNNHVLARRAHLAADLDKAR